MCLNLIPPLLISILNLHKKSKNASDIGNGWKMSESFNGYNYALLLSLAE
jgi:hypothetical protein